ncbi:hypothetical protein E1212_07600 [Jiangella ureilytica]|uniref:DUF916 domain-containing protein n=1 Tax=Jiangella ureilytica TaxID=2530374 RepID=A0A4R4RTN4_9ACTN|nr:hypothetical protein [Jiangella ureilytica]TDC52996.1 hypothetical protein E1212_07600 [Jiangella ureilytica]
MWQLGRLDIDVELRPETSGSQVLDPAPSPATAAARLWVVPWIALTALAIVVLAVVRRRRTTKLRRRTDATAAASVI